MHFLTLFVYKQLDENVFLLLGFTVFFPGPLYTGLIEVHSRFFYLFLPIRVNKDLPRPNFFALGLRSYRRYKKHINDLTCSFEKDSKTSYIFFS